MEENIWRIKKEPPMATQRKNFDYFNGSRLRVPEEAIVHFRLILYGQGILSSARAYPINFSHVPSMPML